MIERDSQIPVKRQAQLLHLSRSSVYYVARGLSERDLKLMRILCTISRNGPARFRVKGPTLHGLPAEPRLESSTGPFSSRQVFWL